MVHHPNYSDICRVHRDIYNWNIQDRTTLNNMPFFHSLELFGISDEFNSSLSLIHQPFSLRFIRSMLK